MVDLKFERRFELKNSKKSFFIDFRREYEMRILDKVMILVSLPELIKILGSAVRRMFKIFDIDLGGDA